MHPPNDLDAPLDLYRTRRGVIFISYCRFWEQHGFVQQSLAKKLVRAGIPVTWFDGSGWRPYTPTLYWNSQLLNVAQLPAVPGRRFSERITRLSTKLQAQAIMRQIDAYGGNPIIWVQGGIDEALAAQLPYIDFYSTFDDPYRHQPEGALCQKASNILCQNSFTLQRLSKYFPSKTHLFLPPLELGDHLYREKQNLRLPHSFPDKIMGYVGSFGSLGFDLPLFERFVKELPEWGFLLMGRTDYEGEQTLNRLQSHKNFLRLPWAPRDHTQFAWKSLDVSLLLYKRLASQDGAFPSKVSESLYFGAPCVATAIPKTADLEGFFPRESQAETLIERAVQTATMPKDAVARAYTHFATQSNPVLYLQRAADLLKDAKASENRSTG